MIMVSMMCPGSCPGCVPVKLLKNQSVSRMSQYPCFFSRARAHVRVFLFLLGHLGHQDTAGSS